jgi:hypothetical protein
VVLVLKMCHPGKRPFTMPKPNCNSPSPSSILAAFTLPKTSLTLASLLQQRLHRPLPTAVLPIFLLALNRQNAIGTTSLKLLTHVLPRKKPFFAFSHKQPK